jgi:hypothetical protein
MYILSEELCDFCNIQHGSKMHMKQIVRKIEDYILNSMFDREIDNPDHCFVIDWENQQPYYDIIERTNYSILNKHLNKKVKMMYLDDKLKILFANIPNDDYIINIGNELAKKDGGIFYKRFTHNFDDIDMYLEMSGHLTSLLKKEFMDTLNKISNNIENVKGLVSISDNGENELIEVSKLLKELEEMYNSK